jgi:hypothetical protein
MSRESPLDQFQQLWQGQERQPMELTVAQIARRAAAFQRTIRRRNVREYVAAALVTAIFAAYAVSAHTALMRLACAAIVAGAIYIVYFLHKHGSAEPRELTACTIDHLASHRRQLERQRDLLLGIWRWYLGPLVPGLVLFAISVPIEQARFGRGPWIMAAILLAGGAAIFAGFAWLNRVVARRLQREIDALLPSTLEREGS